MPTSFSKPLITAPLSLVQTEARQPPHGHMMPCLYLDLLRLSPGLCADHALCPGRHQWGSPAPYPPLRTSRDACEMGTSGRGSSLPPGMRHPHSIFRVCLRICLCPTLLVSLPPEAGAAPGLALFPAPLPPPPWLPARTPEDVVVGIDVQTLAGTIQNASIPHHRTANAVWKRLPRGSKQLGALGVIQEAQGGVDGCGCQTRWGAQRRDVTLEPPQECSWHPICQRSDTRAQRVEGGCREGKMSVGPWAELGAGWGEDLAVPLSHLKTLKS